MLAGILKKKKKKKKKKTKKKKTKQVLAGCCAEGNDCGRKAPLAVSRLLSAHVNSPGNRTGCQVLGGPFKPERDRESMETCFIVYISATTLFACDRYDRTCCDVLADVLSDYSLQQHFTALHFTPFE